MHRETEGSLSQLQLPPGFRFHPTNEELVMHYLRRKADSQVFPILVIAEVDLYKFDPWDLPGTSLNLHFPFSRAMLAEYVSYVTICRLTI